MLRERIAKNEIKKKQIENFSIGKTKQKHPKTFLYSLNIKLIKKNFSRKKLYLTNKRKKKI